MKKLFIATIIAITVFALPCFGAGAEVREIKISAVLLEDGGANITETWDISVKEGTEYYLVHSNMGKMKISDLSVSDENDKNFENIGAWDIGRNMEQKAGKCGIVESKNGYELCWGIGSYGDHVFTVSYHVSGVVMEYADNIDGFNYRFINDKLSSPPKKVTLTIERKDGVFTKEDTGIWAFGYRGDINIVEGKIVAKSSEKFSADSNLTVLARFEPSMFESENVQSATFESVKSEALVGSNYDADPPERDGSQNEDVTGLVGGELFWIRVKQSILPISIGAIGLALIIWAIAVSAKRSAAIKKMYDEANYFRDVPVEGNLLVANYLADAYSLAGEKNAIIGAQLLRWVYDGAIEVQTDEQTKLFGGVKTTTALKLCGKPLNCPSKMDTLYDMLVLAAREDGILQEHEMEKWCSKNADKYTKFVDSLIDVGLAELYAVGGVGEAPPKEGRTDFYKNIFTDAISAVRSKGEALSVKGMEGVSQIMGLKKYLKDFTLIKERRPEEVAMWNDYLVFASLFGIAEEVEKAFKNVYPEYFKMPENNYHGMSVVYMVNRFNRATYHSAQQAQQAARSSGSGGSSSFGGGGGFSGGGSGGGSR